MSARNLFSEYLGPPSEWGARDSEYWPGISDVSIGINADFIRRLAMRAQHIDSLAKLNSFARERWPEWWQRKDPSHPKQEIYETLEQACILLWADFLEWAEADES